MTGLVLATAALHLPPTVSEQLARMSKPEAYGRNVVNVILVDFRAWTRWARSPSSPSPGWVCTP
jgi:multisubunit Na+/H+ antiporter MnhB subunit